MPKVSNVVVSCHVEEAACIDRSADAACTFPKASHRQEVLANDPLILCRVTKSHADVSTPFFILGKT